MRTVEELELDLKKILESNSHIDIKNKALSSLMSEIERDYNFPYIII